MDLLSILARIVAVAYVLFGLLGLLTVSLPDNRQDMFFGSEPRRLGMLRLGLAYAALIPLVLCGLAVFLGPPRLAITLAWIALAAILSGKGVGLIFGERHSSCKMCLVLGTLVALATTAVIVAGV